MSARQADNQEQDDYISEGLIRPTGGLYVERLTSISPDGVAYPLPKENDYPKEFKRIEALAAEASKIGQEIVVVMGVGFVGAVMAAIVADTTDAKGEPSQVRHRHAEAEPTKLLENPAAQSGHIARKGRGPGSRPDDQAVRARKEDPRRDLRLRRPPVRRRRSSSTSSSTTQRTSWATSGTAMSR